MRRPYLLALAAAIVLAPGVLAQATLFVDHANCPNPGSGLPGDPYCRIQTAYSAAADGDTIRVRAGTYNECVLASDSIPQKSVHLVAEAGATRPTIDATGLNCVSSFGIPTGAVRIGGYASSIDGFRIIGGRDSGLVALGEVTITNNLVENNTSGIGGGMYLYPNPCAYGAADIVVQGNTIRNNASVFRADQRPGWGGGVYVRADAPGGSCPGEISIRLENNTISGNNSDASGGGIFAFTNTAPSETAAITITNNTIDANTALGAGQYTSGEYVLGFGGGVYASTYGYGAETIDVTSNTITGNTSTLDFGGGISASANATYPANQTVRIQTNTVNGNTADIAGGGIEAFLNAIDLPSPAVARILVEGNTITSNSSRFGGAGVIARAVATRSTSPNAEVRVSDNRISTNNSEFFGGGVEVNVTTDSDPDSGFGTIAPASVTVTLERNRINGNHAISGQNPPDGTGGGVFVFARANGDATSTARLSLNTIQGNTIDAAAGAGGVHVESQTSLDTAASEGHAVVEISSSIVAGNDGDAIGGPTPGSAGPLSTGGTGNLDLTVDYGDFFGNDGIFAPWVPAGGQGNLFTDPLLNATTLLPAACSPTLDTADPSLPFAAEAAPNGGRANMGHSGGTAQATPSLADPNGDGIVDGVDVVRLSVAFNALAGQPRYNVAVDFDSSGQVDGADLAFLAGDFGESCP